MIIPLLMPVKGPDLAISTLGDLVWMLLEKVSLCLKLEEESDFPLWWWFVRGVLQMAAAISEA